MHPLVERSGAKHSRSGRLAILSRIFSAVVGVAVVSAAHPGAAQNVSGSAADCKHSTLTGPAFIRLLNTIITHGDLTDVAFIEKTLHTKFSLSYGPGIGGSPDPKRLDYESDQMFGDPIHVDLDINNARQKKGSRIAFISFNDDAINSSNPTFISTCLHMTTKEFFMFFGTGFFGGGVPVGDVTVAGEPIQPYHPTFAEAKKNLDNPGKYGSRLELGIDYKTIDQTINDVEISQWQ